MKYVSINSSRSHGINEFRRLTSPNKKAVNATANAILASQVETEASHEKKITVIQIFEKIREKQSFL
ncbi:MAG: hypothetical protein LBL06_04040 [Treponema sp.]|jgi:hypothetical protein|nr:hypothetical protein [Treponema sp.]